MKCDEAEFSSISLIEHRHAEARITDIYYKSLHLNRDNKILTLTSCLFSFYAVFLLFSERAGATMSFGYSVGDFLAVGQLAWKVYKSCRDAPESFNNISLEVLSLHALLKEVEETLSSCPLTQSKQASLATITAGCQNVLLDLQALVLKYESLGTQSKRTWDRVRWGSKDIAELRARLTSNTMLLTAFLRHVNSFFSTSSSTDLGRVLINTTAPHNLQSSGNSTGLSKNFRTANTKAPSRLWLRSSLCPSMTSRRGVLLGRSSRR